MTGGQEPFIHTGIHERVNIRKEVNNGQWAPPFYDSRARLQRYRQRSCFPPRRPNLRKRNRMAKSCSLPIVEYWLASHIK